MTRALIGLLAAAVSAVAALAWSCAPASAHAVLVESTPADGTSAQRPPAEALLVFNEAPDPVLSAVQVLDASGARVQAGPAHSPTGKPARLRVALGPLGQGTYTVAWRVTSAVDGHPTVGSVAFGVGEEVAPVGEGTDGAPAEAGTAAPTAASVAGRWLFYVGVVVLLGAAVVGVLVVADPAAVSRRVLGAAWAAAAGGLVLTIADYRASTGTSLSLLLSSPTGHKLAAQVAAVALCAALVLCAVRRPSRASLAAVGLGAATAMLARALAGHANTSSLRWFSVGVQWAHLVAVGAWVGGLVWLLVALRRGDPGREPGLVRRFSSVATPTLGVVVVSGVLRSLDEVGGWRGVVGTSFGTALVVKVGLVLALVVLGALNRLRHLPAPARRMGGLRRVLRAEVAIGAGVLGATAVLAGLPPSASVAALTEPRPAPDLRVSGHDYATSVRVLLAVTPGSAGPNHFDATVSDYDTATPVPAQTVALRFRLPDRPDVAPTTLELARHPDDHWRASGTVLSIDGRWRVVALVQTATDAVEVPMEVVTRGPRAGPVSPGSGAGCGDGTPDPTYRMTLASEPDPPRAEGTAVRLTLDQDGRAVTGAEVCVRADMPDMEHPGVTTMARETSEGSYETRLELPMVGTWEGEVTVAEPGRPAVSVPLALEVQ